MMDEPAAVPTGPAPLSATRAEELDRACDRFEAAWRAGERPRIEDYLAEAAGPSGRRCCGELLAARAASWRRRAGERPRAEEYLARFPADAALVRAAFGAPPEAGQRPAAEPHAGRRPATCSSASWPCRTTSSTATPCWPPSPPGSPTRPGPWARSSRDRGALDAARRALLEALVAEHLKQHGGDPEASLAAVSSLGSAARRPGAARRPRPPGQPRRHDLPGRRGRTATPRRRRPSPALAPPRRRAVPHPPLPPRGRTGPRLRRPRRGARPRGRPQGDPARQGRRGRPPRPVRPGGRDQRRPGAPRDRPGLQPGHLRRRPAVLRHAVRRGRQPQGGDRRPTTRSTPGPTRARVEFRKLLGRFVDVCEAIAFAHSKGVLHRDLKPHNVMLGRYGETLVIDWGLAKATGRASRSARRPPARRRWCRPPAAGMRRRVGRARHAAVHEPRAGRGRGGARSGRRPTSTAWGRSSSRS